MKKCSLCKKIKENDCFHKNRLQCKDCYRKIRREWNKNHLEIIRKSVKKWQKRNPGWWNKYNYNYKEKYGISIRAIQDLGLKLALEVYDRAKRKCQKCGDENDLTIHHLDGKGRHNKEKGLEVNNNSDNLIVLCRKCHGSIHGLEGGRGEKSSFKKTN